MIKGVRGLIRDGNKVLLMKRIKKGRTYYVMPGGKLEAEEDDNSALKRELKEETNLDVVIGAKFWESKKLRKKGWRTDHYYLIESYTGKPSLGGPELKRSNPDNQYSLYWADLSEIEQLPVRPIKLRYVIKEQFL